MTRKLRNVFLAFLSALLATGGLLAATAAPASALAPLSSFAVTTNDATAVTGQSVTLSVNLSGGSGTPTGTVDILDGVTTICSSVALNDLAGTAFGGCSVSNLGVGDHLITANYSGDSTYDPETSITFAPALAQTVAPSDTSTALVSDTVSPYQGETVTFTATVSATAPGTGTPTGAVHFTANGDTIENCDASPMTGGVATCATSDLPNGTVAINAGYTGSASYEGSSAAQLDQDVLEAKPTTTVLTTDPNPSEFDEDVLLTATVTADTGTPVGTVAFKAGGTNIVGCESETTTGGIASCTTSAFAVGTQSLTAEFTNSTPEFGPSTSNTVTQDIDLAPTSTVLTSSQNPTDYSEPLTFTATVTPSGATGSVEFKLAGTVITACATQSLTDGVATCSVTVAAGQNQAVTAGYLGDTSYAASDSNTVLQDVDTAATTTAVTSSDSTTNWQDSVTFTATISPTAPATAPPGGGTVSFTAGGTPIDGCTTSAVTNGTATCATGALPVGDSTIVAIYSGNSDYVTSTSPNFTQAVGQAASTTVVTSNLNPSGYSSTVRYTATVSSTAGTPTGTLYFMSGGVFITPCNATVLVNGAGYCETNATPVGTTAITAEYSGDIHFSTGTSAPLSQVVDPAITTTALSSTPSSSVFSESVTFTATVAAPSPATLAPTSTVAFSTLAGCESQTLSGSTTKTATCTVPEFAVGDHPVTAVYAGTDEFASSSSDPTDHVVNKAGTTTAISTSDSPTLYSMDVVLTATVAPVAPATAVPSEGAVEFRDGVNPITGCETQPVTGGVASCTTTGLAAGSHTLRGAFIASDSFAGSLSTGITQTISQAATTLTLDAPPGSKFSEPVTLTATAAAVAPASGIPTGTVAFKADETNIAGCATSPLSNGVATCITDALTIGGPSVTAVYSGSSNFLSSNATSVESDVSAADTSTAVTSSASPSTWSQPVIFTATITTSAPAEATATAGTVTFNFEGTPIAACTALTLDSPGIATCALSALPVGTAAINAVYNGAPSWSTSTAPGITQTVNQALTTTQIGSNPTSSVFGQSVNFQATVSPVAPATTMPTGTLSVKLDGVDIVACTDLPFTGIDTASSICPLSTMAVGDHLVTAVYSGSTNYSTSPILSLGITVSKAATTTLVTSTPNPSVMSGTVTMTATVAATAPGSGTPTGTVGFRIGGGDATGCTAKPLTDGVATCTTASLGVGLHNLSAVYATSTNFLASTSALHPQNVTKASTSTALVSSDTTTTWGDPVTFTATVSTTAPATLAAGGSVSFNSDGITISGCSNKAMTGVVATCTTSALEGGDNTIVAAYSGDAEHQPSNSDVVTQTVATATTLTALTSDAEPSRFGQAVTLTADVTSTAGVPTGSVNFYAVQRDLTRKLVATKALVNGTTLTIRRELPVRMNAPIVAEYIGDGNFGTSEDTVMQTVSRSFTRTLMRSSANPSKFGQLVTLTVNVNAMGAGEGTPKGKVAFYRVTDGVRKWIGTAVIVDGIAKLKTSKTPVGVSSMIAQYNGNGNFRPSSRTGVQRVHAG